MFHHRCDKLPVVSRVRVSVEFHGAPELPLGCEDIRSPEFQQRCDTCLSSFRVMRESPADVLGQGGGELLVFVPRANTGTCVCARCNRACFAIRLVYESSSDLNGSRRTSPS